MRHELGCPAQGTNRQGLGCTCPGPASVKFKDPPEESPLQSTLRLIRGVLDQVEKQDLPLLPDAEWAGVTLDGCRRIVHVRVNLRFPDDLSRAGRWHLVP